MPITPDARTYSAGHYGLELDGQFVGWANSAAGGGVYGVFAEGDARLETGAKRVPGAPDEDIQLQFGAAMGPALYDWLEQTLAHTAQPRNGAILTLDFLGHVVSRVEFFAGAITGVDFPA